MLLKKLLVIYLGLVIFSVFSDAQLVNPIVSITGTITDAVTKEPVTVFIVVQDENGKRINATRSNAAENGYYYITSLKPGHKYTLVISQPSYLKEKYDIDISKSYTYNEISKDFTVKPLSKGAKIPISVPPFELNKSKLRFGSEYILDDLKNTMLNNPNVTFEIQCYPDDNDNQAENQKLTSERANSLKSFFMTSGITQDRITLVDNSKTDPNNPPPKKLKAKGKRYIGSTYIKITNI